MPIIKPIRGSLIKNIHPLRRDLVGCWVMNEGKGDVVYDLSGYGHKGILTNGPVWVPGEHGSALQFDGTATPNYTHVLLPSGTIGTWAQISIVGFGRPGSNQGSYGRLLGSANSNVEVYHRSGGNVVFLLDCQSGSGTASGGSYALNQWYHYAAVYDGNDIRIYCDSVLVDTDSTPSGTIDDPGTIYFGCQDADSETWDGLIEYIYIWTRGLTAAEIKQLYLDPFCMFEPIDHLITFLSPAIVPLEIYAYDTAPY